MTTWRSTPNWTTTRGRVAHQEKIDAAIGAWTGRHPLDEVLTALDHAGVPAGPIYTAADIVKDPHYAARGMLETHRTGSGDAKFPGIVPRLEQHPGATRWLGPDLGADTDHILDGLGLSRHQKAQLRPGGVVE
ncbi:CoA transferase [Actinoplanes sp. NPDC051343]|uniref:CoA transferase n=1 Tax=Actinoplanes sp. NPDC051343 TaxID=3363906 RepID=UPI0037970CBA